ncbi:MAG: DNA gyrase/topoisomerase IV subunit A [Bacteroidetes bacterium]|nr:DNA gyrase/topoisomerase IV subunit A [Bacteroidota bacterium]MDA1336408.1 DNA gyrase/topoisomerase IV subunit A [Bacteroidota bacterium]
MSEEEFSNQEERSEEMNGEDLPNSDEGLERVIQVSGMYNTYFLDYASYVILERAVPHQDDGLKPVQRRILHSLEEMDDGRFHKVANVIGNTMKYHPHGDASIGDAMVQIGQKDLLLDCQGNWGNIYTGDRAAAPRYIEVRLSKLGKEILFNPKTTTWLQSYDGRNREPETLPVKFPLLLASGVEGIAVGLACKTLPHNFVELIDASIATLQGKGFKLYPDFPTGGTADVEHYNDGLRGGKVRVRGRIEKLDNKTLVIRELPFGVTTTSLIESVLKANDKGKIKIKRVEDNTANEVEIVVHLANNVSPDKMIGALYAFTDCEVSISPNSTVILNDKPQFLGVSELLKISTQRTKELLGLELEIELSELQEKWHFASLEKIFIENRIYRDIEECETWEEILSTIHKGLKPHIKHLLREVTDEDVTRLTEIRIKRISKFDSFKADRLIEGLEGDIDQVKHHLNHLTDYAIEWFRMLKKKYGEGRERKTELRSFESITRAEVAVANVKLYAQKEEGFVGYGLKRGEGELVCECSDIDDIIVIRNDGVLQVSKVSQKAFFGKDLLHVGVWKRGDERTVYNCIYLDGTSGRSLIKRFNVPAITRDREYHITKGTAKSRILYFSANPNGEAEVVTVFLRANARLKKMKFDVDFSELAIRGRGAGGNLVSKNAIRKIELSEEGVSTLGARKVWYDETVRTLNADGRGRLLGEFMADDRIIVFLNSGEYELTGFDLNTRFDDKMIHLEKWNPEGVVSAVYFEGEKEDWYVKRFNPELVQKSFSFIGDHENSRLGVVSTAHHPLVRIRFNRRFKETRNREDEVLDVSEFIAVKGARALGNKLSSFPVTEVQLDPIDEEKERLTEMARVSKLQAKSDESKQEEEMNTESKSDDSNDNDTSSNPNTPIQATLF